MTVTIEQIARIAHEANRAIQRLTGETENFPWENTTDTLRQSGIAGVRAALDGATPEELHAQWVAYKQAEGWVFGDVKDFAAKTHPCLVPYGQLDAVQRAKDHVFQAVVEAFRPMLDET